MDTIDITHSKNLGIVSYSKKIVLLNKLSMRWLAIPKSFSTQLLSVLSGEPSNCTPSVLLKLNNALEHIGLSDFSESIVETEQSRKKPILARIQITNKCNLSCKYCFNDLNGGLASMDWDTLKNCIDFFINRAKENRNIQFLFYGGEALIEWDILIKGINYILENPNNKNNIYQICIITNGILLDAKKINFLKENKVTIGISYDGIKSNDIMRTYESGEKTSKKILSKIKLLNGYPSAYVLTTITKYNDKNIYKIVKELQDAEIPAISIRSFNPLDNAFSKSQLSPNPVNYINGLIKVIDGIVDKNIWRIRVETILRMMTPLITTDRLYSAPINYRCSAGIDVLYISCNGEIKGCDEIPSSLLPPIGNIQNSSHSYEELHKITHNHSLEDKKCRSCNWLYICRGGCTGNALCENQSIGSKYKFGCLVQNALYPVILDKVSEKKSILKEYFYYHTNQNH
jgi:uncharacterized protein